MAPSVTAPSTPAGAAPADHADEMDTPGNEGPPALDAAPDEFPAGRAADGDLAAFPALLRRMSPALRAYINRITRRPQETDDVLQEVALIVWQQLPGLRESALVRPWMLRIASRAAFAQLRRIPHHALADEERAAEDPSPEERAERRDRLAALSAVLSGLPHQQARCWVLREMGGYTYGEIAEQLEVPTSTVRGALSQA